MSKKVGVILVNWNSFEFTNQCILSLKKCNQEIFDIIVVDNGSNDWSNHELKKSHSDVVLIQSETNTGFAGGNNLGIDYALKRDYTYIMLLNNDTFVEENFLTVLVDYMDQNSDVGIIQPKIFCHHNRKLLWNGGSYYYNWITLPYTKGYLKPASHEFNRIKEVDWVTGCAFFTRSSILKEVGTLEEKFFIYFEDVDLSFRIKKQGYKLIYHPFSIIYHIAGMSNKSKVKQKEGYVNPIVHYLNQRNRIWFIKRYVKWYSLLPTFFYNFFYTAAIMSYFVIFKRFKKLKAVYDGSKDGFLKSI
ncbi:MAG: glycosyltransferase family 2 protein [Bacteroidetes bacterium]|nr:glycosyltransferase family 2 protein [Bacteroidota bacterium]MBU1484477.1 glycosyltransferase family 2 protein [Bacteroidota bacterium]MBU2267452.1 glycosyltransferase family 2 protein [Bacteroidota bacterium]MBU2375221.1 glycosyltransferase family 2 protein [Bacteroidota bacterium]